MGGTGVQLVCSVWQWWVAAVERGHKSGCGYLREYTAARPQPLNKARRGFKATAWTLLKAETYSNSVQGWRSPGAGRQQSEPVPAHGGRTIGGLCESPSWEQLSSSRSL